MTLRKTAGLLAVSGLIVGLLGSGVGASFFDSVTGTENIAVGTFDCQVTGVTGNGTNGNWFDANSATYNAPTILSSAPGSAPFSFTVKNFGSIPMVLSVSAPVWGGTLDGSFSAMAASLSAAILAPGATSTVSTGVQWTALDNADLGDSGSATWTVACGEIPPNAPMASTNANNQTKVPQWANFTAVPGTGSVTLTFHQNRNFYSCFEWRTDGDMSQMTSSTNYNSGIHDGLYPYHCLNVAGTSWSITLGPTIGYVDVRMVFGAESDERFDWTRVNAL